MTEPLISSEVCNAFPIACVIAFVGFCAFYFGWQMILSAAKVLGRAAKWDRFCLACGGEDSAMVVLVSAEHTVDAASEVMLQRGLQEADRNYELTSDYRVRLARFNEDCQ